MRFYFLVGVALPKCGSTSKPADAIFMVYKYSDLVEILIYETRTEDKLETLCTCTGCRTSEPSNNSMIVFCAFVQSIPASHTSIVGICAIPTQTAFLLAVFVKLPCASLLWGKSVTLKFTQVISTNILYIYIYIIPKKMYIYFFIHINKYIYIFIYIHIYIYIYMNYLY